MSKDCALHYCSRNHRHQPPHLFATRLPNAHWKDLQNISKVAYFLCICLQLLADTGLDEAAV